ncbi:hypothetical protein with transposase-mut domain [Prevotella intermedia]|uniref:Mutator family transposase n=1 Tax=Prevotella intermedia TaxID=28131 RepID=A0A0T7APQ7_PREIN|nr:hypothetical protein with transposase-mut domain [Prevotella intermedia]
MELIHSQISEILSNYTSSSEGFVTLQSLIMATFISTRRDRQVSKEAYYTILGVLEDGSREVLTVVNHPTEGALCWKDELEALRQRGVEQIDLVVSDALQGIENAVCEPFPVPHTSSAWHTSSDRYLAACPIRTNRQWLSSSARCSHWRTTR